MTRKWLLAFLILIMAVAAIIPLSLYYYHAHSVNNAPLINSILELPGSDLPISVTYTHNHIRETVTVFQNGEYYCIFVSFTNVGNKAVVLHVTNTFKTNSTIGIFGVKILGQPNSFYLPSSSSTFGVEILDLENNKSYLPCPILIIHTTPLPKFWSSPVIILENFTFYPGETIWCLERLCYAYLKCACFHLVTFLKYACSHLVTLKPGKYEVIVSSWLTNCTIRIPICVNNIIGFYLINQNGKMYAILPPGVCKIEICNIQINFTRVCNYEYEIDNAQQLASRFPCLTNCCHFIPLYSKIWVNGQEYNVTIYSTSHLPSIC
ncbi:MAG: hypothetical protein RXR43_16465 [Sulfolobus sp.]